MLSEEAGNIGMSEGLKLSSGNGKNDDIESMSLSTDSTVSGVGGSMIILLYFNHIVLKIIILNITFLLLVY